MGVVDPIAPLIEILPPTPALRVRLPAPAVRPSIVLEKIIGCEEVVSCGVPDVETAVAKAICPFADVTDPLKVDGPVPFCEKLLAIAQLAAKLRRPAFLIVIPPLLIAVKEPLRVAFVP